MVTNFFCPYDFQLLEALLHIDRELQIGVQLRAFDVLLRHVASRACRGPEPSAWLTRWISVAPVTVLLPMSASAS